MAIVSLPNCIVPDVGRREGQPLVFLAYSCVPVAGETIIEFPELYTVQ